VAVALPEEMPVSETLVLARRLREELGIELAQVVVNALYPQRLGPRQAAAAEDAIAGAKTPLVRAALGAAVAEHTRAGVQREQLARLADGLGRAPLELPYLFAPVLDSAALAPLADALEPAL
jgi:hypothetical protein